MRKKKWWIGGVFGSVTTLGLVTSCGISPGQKLADGSALAKAYLASAAEKRAMFATEYNMAQTLYDQAVSANDFLDSSNKAVVGEFDQYKMIPFVEGDYSKNEKPEIPAVVVDLDETFLDNTPFQAYLMFNWDQVTPNTLHEWILSEQATIYPGVLNFVNHVYEAGGVVLFDSDRIQLTEIEASQGNLNSFGYTKTFNQPENYWMKGVEQDDPNNPNVALGKNIGPYLKTQYELSTEVATKTSVQKEARFQYINDRTNYEIVMKMGDNLDDFNSFGTIGESNDVRNDITSSTLRDLWGKVGDEVRYNPATKKVVDPTTYTPAKTTNVLIGGNTAYGGWVANGLGKDYYFLSREEQWELLLDGARPPWMPAWNGKSDWNGITELSAKYKRYISMNGEI